MTVAPDWLPPLVLLGDHGGDWERYARVLYGYYRKDFVDSSPTFLGMSVRRIRHPIEQGKEATFWHLISEGKAEEERLPDLRRCERIRWPRPIVEHPDEPTVRLWHNRRKGRTRICIWLVEMEYVVVLEDHGSYVLLLTAYPATWPHTKRRLQREYEACAKTNAAP